jgi:hypothetical protein
MTKSLSGTRSRAPEEGSTLQDNFPARFLIPSGAVMGLYRSRILPWLVDKGTSTPA